MASTLFDALGDEWFCVTAVRGLGEADVLARLGAAGPDPLPRYPIDGVAEHFSPDNWAVRVYCPEGAGWAYVLDAFPQVGVPFRKPVLKELSRGTEAVSVWQLLAGTTRVAHARDGEILALFYSGRFDPASGKEPDRLNRGPGTGRLLPGRAGQRLLRPHCRTGGGGERVRPDGGPAGSGGPAADGRRSHTGRLTSRQRPPVRRSPSARSRHCQPDARSSPGRIMRACGVIVAVDRLVHAMPPSDDPRGGGSHPREEHTVTTGSGRRRGRGTRIAVSVTAILVATAMAGPAAAASGGAPAGAPVTAQAIAMSDPTPEEQEQLRAIAGAIWTPELAAGWNMNAEVADVLSTATGEILKCSEAFALVPRPAGFVPGLGYLVNYWKNLRDYFLAVKSDRAYRACVVTAAANYRSPIEMASMGI